MRVTAETKQATRRRILECSAKLFQKKGFDLTTTRDVAEAAGIAAGTVFNYFSTKESIALALLEPLLVAAQADFDSRLRGDEGLEELLFAHVAAGLRRLEAHRRYVGPVLETALSPLAAGSVCPEAERIRIRQLETVQALIGPRASAAPAFLVTHLYWTLYLGVLAFWSADESPHQEDTLVVLDQSMRAFAAWLASGTPVEKETPNDSEPG